ncbi:MAG: C40 family peptidase [Chloroflexota bacterium]
MKITASSRLAITAAMAVTLLVGAPSLAGQALSEPAASIQSAPLFQEAAESPDAAGEASEQPPVEGWRQPPPSPEGSWEEGSPPDAEVGSEPPTEEAIAPEERISPSSRGGPRPGESSPATTRISSLEAPNSPGDRVAAIARSYLGYPYAWAGDSPQTGFDCSGFDEYVYREAGIPIPPHDLWGQMNSGSRVAPGELQPGDLVFFQNTYVRGLSHGGIYLGDGHFVHATDEGSGVRISSLGEGYWAARFLAGSRPWAAIPGR